MKVKKRNGVLVDFNPDKIINAIKKAFMDVDGKQSDYSEFISKDIAMYISSQNKDFTVEEIQDIVVDKLISSSRKDVGISYIEYRYKRKLLRDKYDELMAVVKEKLEASAVQNSNANMDENSFGGRIGEAANEIFKAYALDYCMCEQSKYNHVNNIIYQHDLSSYAVAMHNCLTIPFDDLFANGFDTRQTDVRAPQSIGTGLQLAAVIFQIQSLQQFGGVSASHLDWTMVPLVRKSFYKHYRDGLKYIVNETIPFAFDKDISIEDALYNNERVYQYAMDMTVREADQSVEGLYHNLNTLQSRSGNQLEWWLAL